MKSEINVPVVRWDERIKIRHLRAAIAIQDSGSVTTAAENLFISQAAVSKTITEAEQMLGANLFVRRGRGIVATEAGHHFIESGRRIFAEMKVLIEEIDQISKGLTGKVIVGSSAVSAHLFNAKVVTAMKIQSPGVNLCLLDDYGPEILIDLRSGIIDLAIAPLVLTKLSPDLQGIAILHADPVVVASAGHPALFDKKCEWASLMEYSWCLAPSFSRWRITLENHLAKMGIQSPKDLVESPSALTLLALLQAMPMLSVLPRSMAETWERQGLIGIVPQALPMNTDPIGLIWSTNLTLTPAARLFKETVLAELKNTETLKIQ